MQRVICRFGWRPSRLFPVVCCYLSVGVSLLAGAIAHAGPRIVCAQPAFEFVISNGQSHVEHSFELGNEGDAPLVIEKVHACCGATVKWSLNTIPPAMNSVLEVSMDLRGKRGQIRKSIYVHTNDPQCPILSIRLIGMVPPVVVSP